MFLYISTPLPLLLFFYTLSNLPEAKKQLCTFYFPTFCYTKNPFQKEVMQKFLKTSVFFLLAPLMAGLALFMTYVYPWWEELLD